MKYIDSIHDEGANRFSEIKSDGELLKVCNTLFAEYERLYDKIIGGYKNNKSRWHIWDSVLFLQEVPSVQMLKKSERIWCEFLHICSEYFLLCMDATTAYKYLLQTETDWEYRYFVRKIYLLMHETQPLLGRQKDVIAELHTILHDVEFEEFEAARKRFFVYIQKYDKSDFDFVRDKIEAHRDKDSIDDQIKTIHDISAKRSGEIVLEGFEIMVGYSRHLLKLVDDVTNNINAFYYYNRGAIPCSWDIKNRRLAE